MLGAIFDGLGLAITSCFGWFQQTIESLDFGGVIIGAFTIVTIARFLLTPLVGAFNGSLKSGASDMVSGKSKSRSKSNVQKNKGGSNG